jgi:16S rRNA (cytidine1402-2'-O)-methyltransferase
MRVKLETGRATAETGAGKADSAPLAAGLYLVATPIGNLGDITLRALETLRKVDVLACEDTREAGKLAQAYGFTAARVPYHDHNGAEMRPKITAMIAGGKSVALISDAGTPLVSDPGFKLVEACLAENLPVTCLPGACAALAALSLSGLPADRFFFRGFLPPRSAARKAALSELKASPATLVFYETAPRLLESLEDMQEILGDRRAAVARELTKKFEQVLRNPLSALIAHYRTAGAPKGEIAVIVEGPQEGVEGAWTAETADALLRRLLSEEGLSVKDAAAMAAAQSGLKKSDLYRRALELRKELER